MHEITAFRNRTAQVLSEVQQAQDWNRGVFAPACPFHGLQAFGSDADPDSERYQVPANSQNTLGETLFKFNYKNETE
jgi:hypothetical protein